MADILLHLRKGKSEFMEEKKTKITLRFTETQCRELKSEAEKNFMTVSDYIRGIIFDNQNYSSKTLGKGSRELLQVTPEILTKVNQELIRMEHNLERLRGAKKVQVAELKGEVDEIWQLLN